MKILAVLSLLAAAIPATAQQPVITDFGTNGMVTWTNPDTNAFFATDWTWNLNYNWIQPDSMARATQSMMQTYMWDLGVEDIIPEWCDYLIAYAESMGDDVDALFVRIRISPDPPACGHTTNWLRVCNVSTSALENLRFGIESSIGNRWGDRTVPVLANQSNTTFHAVAFAWPNILNVFGGETDAARYFIEYTQDGEHRDFVTDMIMPIGPPRKNISFVVSNSSYTISFDWLPRGKTTTY